LGLSVAQRLARLPLGRQAEILEKLSDEEKLALVSSWAFLRRPEQALPEGRWRTALWLAGRGFGKTRVGAEGILELVEQGYRHIGLIGRTEADTRDVMIHGPAGIMACAPAYLRPRHIKSERRLEFPNGAVAITYSAAKPDQLRGPQHDLIWADEVAAWRTRDAWDQASFGLRLPHALGARAILTTTPQPKAWLREIMGLASTRVIRGKTSDNIANLNADAVRELFARYKDRSIGRQELEGELFDEAPGALWKRLWIENGRRTDVIHSGLRERWGLDQASDELRAETARAVLEAITLPRVVVAVDPATTSEEGSDETGILVCGTDHDRNFWVLEDVSGVYTPNQWAHAAREAFHRWGADKIVAEDNQGGEMVESQLRQVSLSLPVSRVHATRGKAVRAGPCSGHYEQGKARHIQRFTDLEDQLCGWEPGQTDSPDRLDALVWGFTELLGEGVDGGSLDLGLGNLRR